MGKRLSWLYIVLALVLVAVVSRSGASGSTAAAAQDTMMLDRRITTLEQRLYSIESNITQLQQQVSMAQRTQGVGSSQSVDYQVLRGEMDSIRLRMAPLECAVAKLDQRTLTAAQKAAAPKTDPCRLSPDSPVDLPSRR